MIVYARLSNCFMYPFLSRIPRKYWKTNTQIALSFSQASKLTLMSVEASAAASTVWGTWRFISSPSKSAL